MAFPPSIKYFGKCHITTMLHLCAFPKTTTQMQQKHSQMQHQIVFGSQITKKYTQKWGFTHIFMKTAITFPDLLKQ